MGHVWCNVSGGDSIGCPHIYLLTAYSGEEDGAFDHIGNYRHQSLGGGRRITVAGSQISRPQRGDRDFHRMFVALDCLFSLLPDKKAGTS